MTPQERQLIDDLFGRLSKLEGSPRDPDAVAAMAQGLRSAPNAVYALVQTVLLQDEALKRANHRIQELEAGEASQPQQQSGGIPQFDARNDFWTGPVAWFSAERAASRCRQPAGLEQRPGDAAGAIPWPWTI